VFQEAADCWPTPADAQVQMACAATDETSSCLEDKAPRMCRPRPGCVTLDDRFGLFLGIVPRRRLRRANGHTQVTLLNLAGSWSTPARQHLHLHPHLLSWRVEQYEVCCWYGQTTARCVCMGRPALESTCGERDGSVQVRVTLRGCTAPRARVVCRAEGAESNSESMPWRGP
jgi:hypothetical protein